MHLFFLITAITGHSPYIWQRSSNKYNTNGFLIHGMIFLYCFSDMRNMDFPPTFDPYTSSHDSFFFPAKAHTPPAQAAFRPQSLCTHQHQTQPFCQKLPGNTKHEKGWRDSPGPPRQQQCRDLEGAAGPTQHHQPQVHSSTGLLSNHTQILVQPCPKRNLLAQSVIS